MNGPAVARTSEGDGASSLSRSRTAFLVAALVASVISFQLNATMLGPAIRDINTELRPDAFASMSNFFYLSGAIANVVFIRWSDYIGRKRVLLGIMIVLCVGTVLCLVSTSLPVVLVGPGPAGWLQRHVRSGVPDLARTPKRPGIRLLLWCHRVDQWRGGWC